MFYKNFSYIKHNYFLILFQYIVVIIFVLITYTRNEDAAYITKGSNLNEIMNFCKQLFLREGQNWDKIGTVCEDLLQEDYFAQTQVNHYKFPINDQITDFHLQIDDGMINIPHHERITPITILYLNYIYNEYLQKLSDQPPQITMKIELILFSDTGLQFNELLDLIRFKDLKYHFVVQTNTAFFCALGPIFAAAYFVLFYVKERTTLFRFIQRIAGLNTGVYWLVAFIIDYVIFLTVFAVFFGMILLVELELYSSIEEISGLIITTIIFPFAILPITYLFSLNFKNATYGYIWTLVGYVFFGKILY